MGPARIGYLNDRKMVDGREVAVISVDEDRAGLVEQAFDLFATGEHTITTITDLLEDMGLRTRATPKRPSKRLSRSMVHRMLSDDYYIGVVTLNGVKRQGRHEALIDPEVFEQVQQVLKRTGQRRPLAQAPPLPRRLAALQGLPLPAGLRAPPRQRRDL